MSELNSTFPRNLFVDLNVQMPSELPQDFYPSFLYVLNSITSERNVSTIIYRYRDCMTFDEIGKKLNITRQRAQMIAQDIIDRLRGKYAEMLVKGLKQYADDLLISRIDNMLPLIAEEERNAIVTDTYTEAYNIGYRDGSGQSEVTMHAKPLAMIKIDSLPLSTRTFNALTNGGIHNLGQVVEKGDRIASLASFGKGCFIELANLLHSYGVRVVCTFPRSVKKFDWREPTNA